MRGTSERASRRREKLAAVAALAFVLGAQALASSARADVTPTGGQETGNSAMSYPASPRTITWLLQSTPTGAVDVELSDALTGASRAFTGPQSLREGASITVYPPMLEAGTYVLSWTYPTLLGQVEGTRAVHVGTPTSTVSNSGETLLGVSPLIGLALMLTGLLFAALFAPAVNRQRPAHLALGRQDARIGLFSAAALTCLGLSTYGALSTWNSFGSVGLLTWFGVLLGVAAAGTFVLGLVSETKLLKNRAAVQALSLGGLWGAVLAGAAGGWCLGAAGQWPLLTAPLGAAGGAGFALFAAALARAAASAPGGDLGDSSTAQPCPSEDGKAERVDRGPASGLLALGAAGLLLVGAVFLSRLPGQWDDEALLPLVVSTAGVGIYMLGLALAGTRAAQNRQPKLEAANEDEEKERARARQGSMTESHPASTQTRPMARGVVFVALGLLLGLGAPLALAGASEVRALPTSDSASAQECLDGGNFLEQSTCLDYVFTAKTRSGGTRAALDELRDAQTQFPQLRAYCHETSHAIGRASVGLLEGSIARAFEAGYDVCDFGYYHGVIEGAAGGLSDTQFLDSAPSLCTELASSTPTLYFQCFHGIGHAAARRTNNDINRGLGMCDAIRQIEFERAEELEGALNGCGTGVTMEWFSIAQKAGLEFVLPEVQDIKDVCLSIDRAWARECVEYLANTLDTANAVGSLNDIVSWCETNTDQMQACLRGVARTSAALGLEPEDVLALCERDGPSSTSCIESYLIYLATTVEFNVDAVGRVCALLPAQYSQGPESPCGRASRAASEVLASLDGKSESLASRNSGVNAGTAGG